MIPSSQLTAQSVIPILGLPVFGFFVGTSILVGLVYVFTYGARKYQISRQLMLHWLAISTVATAAGAHWVELLFYRPDLPFFENGNWLKFFDGIASTGATAGALIGTGIFVRLFRVPMAPFYAVGFEGWALVWFIGRIGCALLNEHLGGVTTFFLGVRMPDGLTYHDLGLYECLFLFFFLTLYVWRRRNAAPDALGMVATTSFRYGIFRFFLDYLRPEPRYFSLTFAQYFSLFLLVLAGGIFLWRRRPLRLSLSRSVA